MTEQDKLQDKTTPDVEPELASSTEQPEPEAEPVQKPQEDQLERLKETTEKIWGSTLHAFSTATFKANQYKKLVQKKIDISALHKKIGATHGDLGKLIDDLREAGKKGIMNQAEVKNILDKLDDLKAQAAALEEEVEQLKLEEQPHESVDQQDKSE